MSSAVASNAIPAKARFRRPVPRITLATAAAASVLTTCWPWFVFTGSQLAFLLSAAGGATAAWLLAQRRSWLAMVLVLVVALLLGTEASGALGRGSAPLGSLRLLDVVLLATLGGLTASIGISGALTRIRRLAPGAWLLLGGLAAWLLVLWALHGAPVDSLTKTDVRLGFLAAGAAIAAAGVLPGRQRQLWVSCVLLALVLALKAAAIKASGLWTIGTADRLQALNLSTPEGGRVILVGGDTLLIVAPALALALAWSGRPYARALLAAGAVAALLGTLLSGTRTSVVISVLLLGLVLAFHVLEQGRLPPRRVLLWVAAAVPLFVAAAVATGVVDRFATKDAPGTGLAFRVEEVRTAAALPPADLLFGQGLGGRFISEDARGRPVVTSWSHVLPVWVALKLGVLGLGAVAMLLILLLRRLLRVTPSERASVAPAAVVLGGLLLMSLTLGRAAQPEGAILTGTCLWCLLRG